jgi:ubiquinone/menaquinone biosynthesis C-methylase UbiE
MTDQGERYDRMAAGYERWWAPVLAPSAIALLDRLDASTDVTNARDVIDIGVGTGNLALTALRRWPAVRVTGIDASREMIEAVGAIADRTLGDRRDRFDTRVAFAAELPFGDHAFDLAVSSFVLQLVPNRAEALREIRRVLRPGGSLAYVTWLADRSSFAPDRVFDGVLADFGFEDEPGDGRVGDVPSVSAAIGELRRAGFREVSAEGADLAHAFTVDSYISFLVEFDEESTFAEMDRRERHRFLRRLREGLMALPPDDLVFRAPIVYAKGRRTDR